MHARACTTSSLGKRSGGRRVRRTGSLQHAALHARRLITGLKSALLYLALYIVFYGEFMVAILWVRPCVSALRSAQSDTTNVRVRREHTLWPTILPARPH